MAKKKTAKAKTARKRAVKDLAPKKTVKGGMANVNLKRYE